MSTWTAPPLPARWAGTAIPSFVGRRRELTAFEEAWSAVGEGARQLIFVGGEPGVGKSRLVAEAAGLLHRQGAAVLLGSCIAEFGAPYQPFIEPIESLLPAMFGEQAVVQISGAESAKLMKQLSTLLGGAIDDELSGRGRQYETDLYGAAAKLFQSIAAQRPLVLVLEDLHLAGSASLQLLTYVVEHTAESRILLLVTHRTTPADRSDQLVHAISALYRLDGVRRIDLSGLDTEEIVQYLMRESGVPLTRARSGAVLLREQTGGNPFFLRELWRDVHAHGGLAALRSGNFAAPESVRDTLQSRLDQLAPAHRRTVELAAVIGDDFDVATVCAAAGCSAAEALVAIDAGVDLGLLSRLRDSDGTFHFVHALARQAVLDLMASSRLAAQHFSVAQVLEARDPQTEQLVPRLAHHYASAAALGHADRAVRYLISAARLSDRSLAHLDAAGQLERAASLSTDAEQYDELRLAAAARYLLGADFGRARDSYAYVAEHGVDGMRLSAATGFEIACWRTGQDGTRATELLTAEMDKVDRDVTDPNYVRALASLGRAVAYTGEVEAGELLCDAAVECARSIGDDNLLADTLEACLGYALVPRAADIKLRRATELSQLGLRNGDLRHLAVGGYNRAVLCYLRGDLPGMEAAQADVARGAKATGQAFWTYTGGAIDYSRRFVVGDFDGAERTCTALLEMAESFGTDDADGPYGVHMFMLRRETGALEQVRGLVRGDESPSDHWAPGLLGLYTELRMANPAARLLRWLLDNDSARNPNSAQWPGVLALMTEAALFLADAESARRLLPELSEFTGMNLLLGGFDGMFGSADRYIGAVHSLLGEGTPEDDFAAALEMDTNMKAPVHQAQTLALFVTHLRRVGASGQRVEALTAQALAIAEPLRLARVLTLLASPGSGRPARADGLTARELDVLHLLSEGLSNRGIARQLVISENTAANHVRNILAKTGAENRTQAAIYGRDKQA